MTTLHRVLFGLLAAGLFIAAAPARAADTLFIGDFEALGNDWVDLADKAVTVEGRISSFSAGRMRFVGSRLSVQLPAGTRRPSTDRVSVSGLLKRDRGQPTLDAFGLKPLPDTTEWLDQQRVAIRDNDPAQWYEAATEIARRADHYDDDVLRAKAAEFNRRGFDAAVLRAGNDPAKLRAVAEAGSERGIDSGTIRDLRHAASQRQREAIERALEPSDLPRQRLSDLRDETIALRDRVGVELPGATDPIDAVPEELAATYERLPDRTYNESEPDGRPTLHRLLYLALSETAADLSIRLRPDSGDAIADDLAMRTPERPDLITSFRLKAADEQLDRVGTLSEDEAVALSQRLTDLRSQQAGQDALARWLAARRPTAELDGAVALAQLARDTQRLTGDTEAAAELAIAALQRDSRSVDARTWLEANGYEPVGKSWRPVDTATPRPPTAAEAKRITVGQSAEQARRILGFLPDRTIRLVSYGRVTEYWIYDDLDMVITVERQSGQSEVTEIALDEE